VIIAELLLEKKFAVRISQDEALVASVCCHAPGMFVNPNTAAKPSATPRKLQNGSDHAPEKLS
jgi:hypothetical protein